MTYTGPTGDVNYDVARQTGGPALMTNGEKYTVSEDLAARLLLSTGWKAPQKREAELRKMLEPTTRETNGSEEADVVIGEGGDTVKAMPPGSEQSTAGGGE